jgi:hypothetical protein
MRVWLTIAFLLAAVPAFAGVSVTASVDRNRVPLGETIVFKISVQGATSVSQPSIPKLDGLQIAYAGRSSQTFMQLGGPTTQTIDFNYQLTPTHTGEINIPAISVEVAGTTYQTEPILLRVEKGAVPAELDKQVFVRAQMPSHQVYVGQTMPLDIRVYARNDVPLAGFGGFNYEADGLGYRYLKNLKSGTQTINGEAFKVFVIEGAITPGRTGTLNFGPCVIQGQLTVQQQRRNSGMDSLFDQFFNRTEVRPLPLTLDPVSIEVLPLPEAGKPSDFSGAIGQWGVSVTAKPTEVSVGDPITLTIKISGTGNIDLVSTPKLTGLDQFKTYDPTVKTTKDDLNTTGERVIQQVLIARSTDVKQLPEVRLSYFDPVAKEYKTSVQPAIPLVVKPNASGRSTIVNGETPLRPEEKLGQDIVYLKGDPGSLATTGITATFWVLNILPVLALAGALVWKQRADKLSHDVAYARRSRAARAARKLLAVAGNFDAVQHALQSYIGDRLNIPAAGITASVADERQLPGRVREIFEACDAARFAGAQADLAALKKSVEQVIDELENTHL